MWPWNASTPGTVYLFHFATPIGNAANPRALAGHYVGFCDDFEKRLATQIAGRGAKLVAAAMRAGVAYQVFHWPAPLATEKLIKRTKKTALYCPACCAAAGRTPRPLPTPPAVTQLAFDLDEPLPEIPIGRMDWLEIKIQQEWRALRIPVPSGIDDDLL